MGVISTTRYRKDPKRKSDRRSTTPALNRQASGARGGRATRDATRLRQRRGNSPAINRFRRSERSHTSHFSPYSSSPSPGMLPTTPHTPPPRYFLDFDGDDGSQYPLPLSAGQTPPPHSMMMFHEQQPKPLQNLDYLPMEPAEYGQPGFFGGEMMIPHHQNYQTHHLNHHTQQNVTPTPSQASYMTDTSFMTDGDVPPLMMSGGSGHHHHPHHIENNMNNSGGCDDVKDFQ